MVTTSSILLVAGLACSATNAEDAPVVERTHRSCFLSEQADGSVWIEDLFLPWLYDTTYGRRLLTMPGIRLGADPARDLAPLVARIEERTEARPLPRPRDGKSPLFVLQLETRMRGEVISARVVQAEVLPAGWTLAQEALEAALEEIVAASLTPPGEEKARRVREAIVAGSRALDRMEAMDASPEAIAIVKQVEPRAAIVRTLRDEVERIVGGRLRQYAARLRIVPEGLARGEVANEKGEGRPAMRAAIREWGVEVSEASEDVLAEKLVLKGAIVDRVLPGGSKIGLEAGDLILAYTSPRDLKLDSHHAEFASPVSLLARRAETGGTGGELRVIRRSGLVTLSVPARIEEHVLDWDVYLDQGADGFVRIEKVVVYLGMYGEAAFAPVYRLGPDAARILAPLVTRRASGEGTSLPEYARLPHADGPIVLVNLRAATRVAQTDWATPQQTREIVEARLVSTEFVMPEWVAAWKTLDEVLRDVVALSLTAPGPEKRERLAEAIARGGEAVAAMEKARETAEMRARVARIDPKARVVHTFQRRVAGQWAGTLAGCAASLRIDPPASLGAAARGSRLLEILLASPTAADFIGEVKASCGEDALDDRVLWSSSIRRAVSAWEVEGFDAEGFARLREDAKKTIEDRDAWEAERKKDRPEPEEATLQPWGVVIRRADADLKARDLILRGVKVEKVLPGGSPVGLEAGDVILDYGSIHDIVMGDFWGWPPRDLRYAAERPGARIRVLRSGRAIEIRTPSP